MIDTDNLLTFVEPNYKNKDILHNLSRIERVLQYIGKLLKAGNKLIDIPLNYLSDRKTDVSSGNIYENMDIIVKDELIHELYKIANSSGAKIRFNGDYYLDKYINCT